MSTTERLNILQMKKGIGDPSPEAPRDFTGIMNLSNYIFNIDGVSKDEYGIYEIKKKILYK